MTVIDTVPSLLAELAREGIRLRLVDGGGLEVAAAGGRLTEQLRDRIRAYKPDLVAWLARAQGAGAALPTIEGRPAEAFDPFPPSDLQTSFLIGSTEGLEYHVRPHQYMEFEFDDLDPERYERALNQALRRQRANLVVVREDMLLQAVPDPAPVAIRVSDLRGLPAAEAQRRLLAVREAMQRRELPLHRWPWMDIELSRYGDGRARLHYNNNNFFSDAMGTVRFLEAVRHYYDRPDEPLPELAVSYRDCVLALAELEESPRGQASRKYWRDRLRDWPAAPELPLVAGRDTRVRSRLSRREMVFPAPLWTDVKAHAAGHGLTPTSVLCAAYAEVIAYWSGSRHFLFNNMISHRLPLHPHLPEVLGNFAALYPLEVDWRADEPFAGRARRLQAQVIADLEHTHFSGVKVLQELNQVRGTPGRAALPFAVGSALSAGGARIPAYSLLETPQTLLDCEFWEDGGGLWVGWDVIEAMFPAGLVDAMQAGYEALLARLGTDRLAWSERAFDLLPGSQRAQRERVNATAAPVPAGPLHGRLPERAARLPDRAAVVCAGTTLSYAELERRGRAVAGRLRRLAVGPGDLVAVVLPKGWQQPVAVLGALTAGAAYVPIDPDWPPERIRYLLGDTGARAVLTSAALREGQSGVAGVAVLAVDEVDEADADGAAAQAAAEPTDLAYVIYTSGSTGRPKGVMVDHRGPLNTVADINRRFGITSDDVLFGISSLCFDLSVYDIFGAIDAGATLVLPDATQRDPADWLRLVRAHGVTVWNSVPTLMQLLVEEALAAGVSLPSLRVVLLSGDWIPVHLPDRIRKVAPNARVVSLGGATEASIWSITFPTDGADPGWASIPYGTPLANQTWHALDSYGRDAPVWTPAELHIGGAGVALGYLGDQRRTDAAFVTHPRTGERLYRTGDLGRYLPGGEIELLGRADFQVKIQGYRVEPGEIEHALLACPGVGQAAVVARDCAAGKQLAGFVVAAVGADGGAELAPSALREALAARLPEYLVPDTIAVLDGLPMSANGKVDRRALAALVAAEDAPRPAYLAARTGTESTLVAIWEEVLEQAPIGVHDDFFDIGGHSLAGLRAMRLVTQRLGRRVPLGTLLERRTVAGLAQWLDSAEGAWSPLVWLRDTGDDPPWFFVHPAGGSVLCYRGLAASLAGRFAAFQAPPPGGDGPPARTSVERMAECYLDALVAAQPRGPYRLGGWSSGAAIAFEMGRRLRERGETVSALVVVDAPAPVAPRPVDETNLLLWFVEDLDLGLDPAWLDRARTDELTGLPRPVALAETLRLARAAGAGDPGLDSAALAPTFAVFERVVRACSTYRPATVDIDLLVLRASDGVVSEFATHPAASAPDWGWTPLTTGAVTAVAVGGTHHTVLTDRHVAGVARAIANHTRAVESTG